MFLFKCYCSIIKNVKREKNSKEQKGFGQRSIKDIQSFTLILTQIYASHAIPNNSTLIVNNNSTVGHWIIYRVVTQAIKRLAAQKVLNTY